MWHNVTAHYTGTSPDPGQSSKGSWRKDGHGSQGKGCKHQVPARSTALNAVPCFLLGSRSWHSGLCREFLPDHPLKLEFPGALCPLTFLVLRAFITSSHVGVSFCLFLLSWQNVGSARAEVVLVLLMNRHHWSDVSLVLNQSLADSGTREIDVFFN